MKLPERIQQFIARHALWRRHAVIACGLTIAFLAVFVRIAAIVAFDDLPFAGKVVTGGDSQYYVAWAERILEGDDPIPGAFFMSPLYPYFLAMIFFVAGRQFLAVIIVQHILGLLTVYFCFRIGRSIGGTAQGLLAAFMFTLSPIPVFHEGKLLLECLLLFLLTASLSYLLDGAGRESQVSVCLAGFLLGLACLGRGNCLLFVPLYAVWLYLRLRARTTASVIAVRIVALLLCTAAAIAPATIRNYQKEHAVTLITSNMGLNFAIGNTAESRGMYEIMDDIRFVPGKLDEDIEGRHYAEKETGTSLTSRELSQFWFQRGLTFWREEPVAALKLYLKKVLLFWNRYEIPQIEHFYVHRQEYLPVLNYYFMTFFLLTPLAFIGIAASWWESRNRLPAALVIVYTLSIALFFITARYRVPIIGLTVILAAAGLRFTVVSMVHRRGIRLATILLVCAGAIMIGRQLPFDMDYTFAQYFNQIGFTHSRRQNYEQAEYFYRRALAIDPAFSTAERNLGDVFAFRGEHENAERCYRNALARKGSDAVAAYNLGCLHHRIGRSDDAEKAYRQALTEDDTFSMAWNNLALLLEERGETQEALYAFQRAIERDPGNHQALNNLGQTVFRLGLHEEAAVLFAQASTLDPTQYRYALNRIAALIKIDRVQEAATVLDQIAESLRGLDDLEHQALIYAFHIHRRTQSCPRVFEWSRDYLARHPDDPVISQLRQDMSAAEFK